MNRKVVYLVCALLMLVAAAFNFVKDNWVVGTLAIAGFLAMLLSAINYHKKNKVI